MAGHLAATRGVAKEERRRGAEGVEVAMPVATRSAIATGRERDFCEVPGERFLRTAGGPSSKSWETRGKALQGDWDGPVGAQDIVGCG